MVRHLATRKRKRNEERQTNREIVGRAGHKNERKRGRKRNKEIKRERKRDRQMEKLLVGGRLQERETDKLRNCLLGVNHKRE